MTDVDRVLDCLKCAHDEGYVNRFYLAENALHRIVAERDRLREALDEARRALRESHGWLANAPIMAPSQPWLDYIAELADRETT